MSSSLSWEDFADADLSDIGNLAQSWSAHATGMLEQAERVTADVIGGPLSADNFESGTAEECRAQLRRLANQFEDDIHDYASVSISATLDMLHQTLDAQQQNLKDLIIEVLDEKFVILGGCRERAGRTDTAPRRRIERPRRDARGGLRRLLGVLDVSPR